jgi:diguanylate cyclase (GGDEF)-like protein
VTALFFLISGLLFGLSFLGGAYLYALPVALISLAFAWLNRPQEIQQKITEKIEQLRTSQTEKIEVDKTEMEVDNPDDEHDVSIGNFRRRLRQETEEEINVSLSAACHSILDTFNDAAGVCIFFPTHQASTMQLRMFATRGEKHVKERVIIRQGQGIVGQLLKEDVSRLIERNMDASSPLYYTKENSDIRSLAAVPIIVNQKRSGVILVDSQKAEAFNDLSIKVLRNMAHLVGQVSYHAYLNMQLRFDRDQLRTLNQNQKKFFQCASMREIYSAVQEIVQQSIPYHRLMILALNSPNSESGRVVLCQGHDEEYFQNMEFRIHDKGLYLLSFVQGIPLQRELNAEQKVVRISPGEKESVNYRSLLTMPVFYDDDLSSHRKVAMVIAVESQEAKRYGNIQRDLLTGISSAAGFALKTVAMQESQQIQSDRDALTGLLNHRAFQEKLRAEKIRSSRVGDALGILLLDMDGFAELNAHYGHAVGDRVLKECARILEHELQGESALASRFGGDEFVVMLPRASWESMDRLAERIRRNIAAREMDIGRVDALQTSVSCGFSVLSADQQDAAAGLQLARKMQKEAAQAGGNKVVGFS